MQEGEEEEDGGWCEGPAGRAFRGIQRARAACMKGMPILTRSLKSYVENFGIFDVINAKLVCIFEMIDCTVKNLPKKLPILEIIFS